MSRRVRIMFWMLGVPAAVCGIAMGCATAAEPGTAPTPAPSLEDGSVVPPVPDDGAVSVDPDGNAPDAAEPTHGCSYDNWCPTPLPKASTYPKKYDLRAVWVAANHEAFAASNGGDVLAWDGVAWKEIYTDGPAFTRIWGVSESELWLVTQAQSLLRGKKDANNVWSFAEVPTPGPVGNLWGVSPTEIWASGSGLYRWNGEGAAWTTVMPPVEIEGFGQGALIVSLWGTGPSDLWASGAQYAAPCDGCDFQQRALLMHWDPNAPAPESDAGADSGSARPGVWKAVTLDPRANRDFYQAKPAGSAGGAAQVFCNDGNCLQTLHGSPVDGSTFELSYSAFPVVMVADRGAKAIWGTSANDVWLVGNLGSVSHFDGTAWTVSRITNTDVPISRAMYSVHGVVDGAESDVWVVGTNVSLHRRVPQ